MPGAPGIAIGTIVLPSPFANLESVTDRRPEDIAVEEAAFREAVRAVQEELRNSAELMATRLPSEARAIFDVYALMLGSDSLVEKTVARIRAGNWAPGALRDTITEHAGAFDQMEDLYLRGRPRTSAPSAAASSYPCSPMRANLANIQHAVSCWVMRSVWRASPRSRLLRALRTVARVARRYAKPVSVCGEMAGDPAAMILLLGMDIDTFSMSAGSIPRIKWAIRSITHRHAKAVLREALQMDNARDIRQLLNCELEQAGLGGLIRPGK